MHINKEVKMKTTKHLITAGMNAIDRKRHGFFKWGQSLSHCIVSPENVDEKLRELASDKKSYCILILSDTEFDDKHIAIINGK